MNASRYSAIGLADSRPICAKLNLSRQRTGIQRMGKTREVMNDRKSDPNKLVTDQKLTNHFEMSNVPGRKAYTLFWKILKQEPDLLDHDRKYTVTLSDLRKNQRKEECKRIEKQLKELNKTEIHFVDAENQKKVWGHLVDTAIADYSREGLLTITLKLSYAFRIYMKQSEIFSILDRTVIDQFSSRYGVYLYQRLAGMQGLKTNKKTWTPDRLRKVLCVPDKSLKRGCDLIEKALEPAIADINEHAPFTVSYTTAKASRRIDEVTIIWKPKPFITKRPTDLKPTSLDDWPLISDEMLNYYKVDPSLWADIRPKFCDWIRANNYQITPNAIERNLEDFLEENDV